MRHRQQPNNVSMANIVKNASSTSFAVHPDCVVILFTSIAFCSALLAVLRRQYSQILRRTNLALQHFAIKDYCEKSRKRHSYSLVVSVLCPTENAVVFLFLSSLKFEEMPVVHKYISK